MKREVRLATIQLFIKKEGKTEKAIMENNAKRACRMLEEAGKEGCDIVCLPECFSTRGIEGKKLKKFAEKIPGRTFELVSEKANKHKMYVVCPIEGISKGIYRNLAMIIDRKGKLVGEYHKVHLTRVEKEEGKIPGEEFPVFNTDFGKIGVMICHDNSFPESARCLALNGAEVIFWPHIQSGWGEVAWEAVLKSRAIDNCIYIVSSSFALPETWAPGMIIGRSGIVGLDGSILAELGRKPGTISASVNLNQPRMVKNFSILGKQNFKKEMLTNRQPKTYRIITKTPGFPISR